MNLAALGLTPDRVRSALRRVGVRDFIDVALRGYQFKAAAWWSEETRTCSGIHITDNPSRVLAKLEAGKDLDVDASERQLNQELGPGLYVSGAPQLWMNRATGKWDFLKQLDRRQQRRYIRALAADVHDKTKSRYVSRGEAEGAMRQLYASWRTGHIDFIGPHLAAQPFNIASWKPEFLAPLGIKPSEPPLEVEVEFDGRFAEMDHDFVEPKVYWMLRKLGFDGAFMPGGFSGYPQTTIWTRRSIIRFGDYRLR